MDGNSLLRRLPESVGLLVVCPIHYYGAAESPTLTTLSEHLTGYRGIERFPMIDAIEFKKKWAETMVKVTQDSTVGYEKTVQEIILPLDFGSDDVESNHMKYLIAAFEHAQTLFFGGMFQGMNETLITAYSLTWDNLVS